MEVFIQQTINGLALGGMYAMLALGLAMVFSILRMINFAHGELMTAAGYGVYFALGSGIALLPAVLFAILCSIALSLLIERLAFRPYRNVSGAILLITSFAVSAVIQIILLNLFSPRPKAIALPAFFSQALQVGPVAVGNIQLVSIGVTIAVLALLAGFLRTSLTGLSMRAAAENFDVARLMGVRANRVILLAFAISGALAGISGLLWVAQRSSVDPMMGFTPVLKAFIAVILGGLGGLSSAVIGGVVLGLIEVYLSAYLPEVWQPFRDALSLLLIVIVLLRWPGGLETVLQRSRR